MTLTLAGTRYPIDVDVDTDATGQSLPYCTWAQDVPACPNCGTLLHDDSVDHRRVRPEARAFQSFLIRCDMCDWTQELE